MTHHTLAGSISRRLILLAAIMMMIPLIQAGSEVASEQQQVEVFLDDAEDVIEEIIWPEGTGDRFGFDHNVIDDFPGNDGRGVEIIREADGISVIRQGDALPALLSPSTHMPDISVDRIQLDGAEKVLISLRLDEDHGSYYLRILEDAFDTEAMIALIGAEIMEHAGGMALLIGVYLLVCIWSVRQAFRPLRKLAFQTRQMNPKEPDAQLPTDGLPNEIIPFVDTINQAFQRIEQVMTTQRAFTAAAAHELRTPLAVMMLSLDRAERLDPAQLRTDVSQMSRIVDQLLALARLDADDVGMKDPVDLTALAQEVVARMAPMVITKGYEFDFDDRGAGTISGNKDALEALLTNLIENALRHTPSGGTIRVIVGPDHHFAVEDSGPGIEESERDRLFKPFQRGKKAGKGGTGLGLAIVQKIAQIHGGGVKVDTSADLGGARFEVALGTA